jgi:hypothetical protein
VIVGFTPTYAKHYDPTPPEANCGRFTPTYAKHYLGAFSYRFNSCFSWQTLVSQLLRGAAFAKRCRQPYSALNSLSGVLEGQRNF